MAMLGGKTRLVSTRRNGSISTSPSTPIHPSPMTRSDDSPTGVNSENVHPALVNYLRAYHASINNHNGANTDGQSTPLEQPDFMTQQNYGYGMHTPSPGSMSSPALPYGHRTPSSTQHTPLVSPMLHTPQSGQFSFYSSQVSLQQSPVPLSNFPAFPQISVPPTMMDTLSNECLPSAEPSSNMIVTGGTGELDVTWQRFMTDMGLSA